MNSETLNLIERPFHEIVDDLLTAIVGGVVNEPIIFDIKSDLYPLAEPAQDVRAITGTLKSQRHAFQKGIDFAFSEVDNGIIWLEEGRLPDDETVFHVDYFRKDSRSPLTDINIGSVTRTLSEAIGREIATVYQQINLAYFSGFIDTAEGKPLDLVVSILGVKRKTKEFAQGLVTFFRDPAVKGNVTIPQGTSLTTTNGDVVFQGIEPRTLQQAQVRIDVPIRASEDFRDEAGKVDAGAITELALPIAGIARVTNLEPTILSAEEERDDQLRARARLVLRSLGKATIPALKRVIKEGRAKLIEIRDPNFPADKRTESGNVLMLVEAEPERFPSLRASVEETRAAGVLAIIVARYIYFKPRIVAELSRGGITPQGKEKVKEEIIEALKTYVDSLSRGEPVMGEKLLKAIKGVDDVSKPKIVDVLAWQTDISQPGVTTLVESLLNTVQSTPTGDVEDLRTALSNTLTAEAPQVTTGRRISDRSLVQATSKTLATEQATNEQIESSEFNVVAKIEEEDWWVVLDMEPADIVLKEKEG